MRLPRRALLTAAAALAGRAGRAAGLPVVTCPLAADPAVLIPGVSDAFATRLLGAAIYRGLMRWNAAGVLQPDLAEAVESAPDGLSHTFHLRPDVTWHDSGGFGADDVAFSLRRFHRELQPRLRLGRLAVDTPDPRTVVVGLPAPDPAFLPMLDALSLPIVPRHVHDVPGWAVDPHKTVPVGTGPFRVAEWLRLVRFEWYAGEKAALAGIDCPIVSDADARLAMAERQAGVLLAGDAVDLSGIPRLRGLPALAVDGQVPPFWRAIAGLRLNPAAKPLDQPEVRLALACAIDRQAALRGGWAGLGRPAAGPLAARDDAPGLPAYGPRAASSHLSAAGLRPEDDGIRTRLVYLHPASAPWSSLYPVLRSALGQVGIELVAEAVSVAEWQRRVSGGAYQMTGFVTEQTGDPATDLTPYVNLQPDVATLLDSGAVAEAQALIVARMPAIWLVEPAIPVARDRKLLLPDGVLGGFARASFA